MPLDHLSNIAYEMATTDICDVNLVDPFYEKAYGKIAINYNRDIEAFPILSQMLNKIYGYDIYKSPTDMGINNVAFAIVDDKAVQEASMQEITRRYEKNKKAYSENKITEKSYLRSEELFARAQEAYKKLNNN